jgi:hypothetical protein
LAASATAGFGVLAAAATGHVGHSNATTTAATAPTSSGPATQAVTTDDTTTEAATNPPVATSDAPVAISGGS